MKTKKQKRIVKITKKEREEATKSFIEVAESIENKTLREYSIHFFKSVGLGKNARNTSGT